jgi:hypothetical protein
MGTEGQVRFRDCQCPGTPHNGKDGADDGDIVYLRPVLGFAAGAEAVRMLGEAMIVVSPTGGGPSGQDPIVDNSRSGELVGPVYIRAGVTGWNLVNEDGPVPLDVEVLLANYTWAYPIAEAADDLYSQALIDPLLKRMNGTSGNGQTGASTRRIPRSSKPRPSRRASSSANGSAGRQSVPNP